MKFLYETNVGAGLPVINTLNDLLLSGDKVISIEAVLSGTLNFLFSTFAAGMNFSDVVKEAKAKGYTEPDPRDDLSGMDVARKILILAREAGLPFELSDISVENLVPGDCQGSELSVEQFFQRLAKHDTAFERLRADAESRKEKLRYTAVLKDGKASVSLGAVGRGPPVLFSFGQRQHYTAHHRALPRTPHGDSRARCRCCGNGGRRVCGCYTYRALRPLEHTKLSDLPEATAL